MKLKFKIQEYQTKAVQAVIDVFKGQKLNSVSTNYQIDLGVAQDLNLFSAGYKNAEYTLNHAALLDNIQKVQQKNGLIPSQQLAVDKISPINLDIEMETGTGKTYCYIKTIFELNSCYGWTKFIIVVPSIAIREGVAKSFDITSDHFYKTYHTKARYFIYKSNKLNELNAFSSDAKIHVMIINIQAFNAKGQEARRIYEECDDFQSLRPIDVISANQPILILDEPQKMGGDKTLVSLEHFKALMVLRYSATHKIEYNKIYRLDAIDAYNQKLVKKIAVHGITVKGLTGTDSYIYLQSISPSKANLPIAYIEFEKKLKSGQIKRSKRRLVKGADLFLLSNELEAYRNGYIVSDINAYNNTISFTNGTVLSCGSLFGNANELTLRRLQIREAIKAHLDKEKLLFNEKIKVLTLFFIDEVAKYRNYASPDEKGDYARIFEEEYSDSLKEILHSEKNTYIEYLKNIVVGNTHSGYFSIDKKTKHIVDPDIKKKTGEADDSGAYDLILKDKERLLSFEEPVRFIFSHSALREGWDNPNVFVICMLKNSDNTISRRQEVGRGLRLCVNQLGERIDEPDLVHQANVLTVVASESYASFVEGLQNEIVDNLAPDRLLKRANVAYFLNKTLNTIHGDICITEEIARAIYHYLIKNDYIDEKEVLLPSYTEAYQMQVLAILPDKLQPYTNSIFELINAVSFDKQLGITDQNKLKKNLLNKNFDKEEFQSLWKRINYKAHYCIQFDSEELIKKTVDILDKSLHVYSSQHLVARGMQLDRMTQEKLQTDKIFELQETSTISTPHRSINMRYDLIGILSRQTQLKRRTVANMLYKIKESQFIQFSKNPENFLAEVAKLINDQKDTMMIEHLTYDPSHEKFSKDIFMTNQISQDLPISAKKLKHHIYDYLIADSKIEEDFAEELDRATEVIVYAKLPRGFYIPTPVGKYNPDWAISFKKNKVKHVYFIAETKGSQSSMELRGNEKIKVDCAKKFFDTLNKKYSTNQVKYDVVNNFDRLMQLVK